MRGLAKDGSLIFKQDKGSCAVVWNRVDYLAEGKSHLSHNSTYKEVIFGEEELVKRIKQSNRMFKQLLSKKSIPSEEHKYFIYAFKKLTNIGKIYFLPKIHKKLDNVPGRPVIPSCGKTTEKAS